MNYFIMIIVSVVIGSTVFKGTNGSLDDNKIIQVIDYLKQKRVITDFNTKDTIFVTASDKENIYKKFYFVNSVLIKTNNKTICDDTRARNGCLKLTFELPERVNFFFTNGSSWDGRLMYQNDTIVNVKYVKIDQ